jgi:hypothetical protein
MNKSKWSIFAGLCAIALSTMWAMPASGQTTAVKAKPPMYSYIANWQIPRARWAEMKSPAANDNAMLDKAMADGAIVGYGTDENLVHTPDGWTHDSWFASMSMAGILKVLDNYYASESSEPSVLQSSTKHWDGLYVSRYYNWKPGSYKDATISVSVYKLKADAPDNALELLSGQVVAPLLEKLIADGTLLEYEIDTLAVHTSAPGTFSIVYVAAKPEDVDKADAAIRADIKANPLTGAGFGAMTDSSAHRDELGVGSGKFK